MSAQERPEQKEKGDPDNAARDILMSDGRRKSTRAPEIVRPMFETVQEAVQSILTCAEAAELSRKRARCEVFCARPMCIDR